MTAGFALLLLDVVLIAAGWPLAQWLGGEAGFGYRAGPAIPVFALSCVGLLYALGFYRRDALADLSQSAGRIPLAVSLAIVAGSSACLALGLSLPPNIFVITALWLGGCTLLARLVFAGLRRRAMFRPHLLVIGAGQRAWDLVWVLRNQGRSLQYDVTFVHEDQFGPVDPRLAASSASRILYASSNLLEIAQRIGADQIVVAPDERRGMALASLITCRTAGYPVSQYASFLEKEVGRIDIKRPDLDWVLYSGGFDGGPVNGALKRILDVLGSALILVCSLGFLLCAMLAVWLGDRGPIFYRQERVTLGGRKFNILKLRTMRIDSEKNGPVWAAAKDARITPVGAFLRRSRLDELAAAFQCSARRHVPGGTAARAPGIRRRTGRAIAALPGTPCRKGRPHRMGADQLSLWRVDRRCPFETELRSLLCKAQQRDVRYQDFDADAAGGDVRQRIGRALTLPAHMPKGYTLVNS